MDIKININEHCRVCLTDLGRKLLLEHWQYILEGSKRIRISSEQEAVKSADICNPGWRKGEVRFQIWEFMQIFGPYLHMGMGEVLFKQNEVILEVPDETFNSH
jgi:hypothetical protein